MPLISNLVYRTDDATRWGNGQGSDLAAVTIDLNFWTLWSAIHSMQLSPISARSIDFISLSAGNQLYVHLTDHSIQGPFTVPTEIWNPRGTWLPSVNYAPLDVVGDNGSLYLVNIQHTSAGTFNAFATDGLGHNLYTLLLEQPADELPAGGTVGQRLVKSSGSPFVTTWESDKRVLALYVEGPPNAGETLLQFAVVDHMTLPSGLTGSVAYAGIAASADTVFTINQNGNPIGTITFHTSPHSTVSFTASINLVPGDIITLVAPAVADATLANISFSFVALLTE
jgi:hypothetical protein